MRYVAFVDPAGGSGGDAMTLAIAHKEGNTAVLDALREVKPPFSPDAVVADFVTCSRPMASRLLLAIVGAANSFAGKVQNRWPQLRNKRAREVAISTKNFAAHEQRSRRIARSSSG